jgi:hypothetical protein
VSSFLSPPGIDVVWMVVTITLGVMVSALSRVAAELAFVLREDGELDNSTRERSLHFEHSILGRRSSQRNPSGSSQPAEPRPPAAANAQPARH